VSGTPHQSKYSKSFRKLIDMSRNQSFYADDSIDNEEQSFKYLQFSKDIHNLVGNTLFKKEKITSFTIKE